MKILVIDIGGTHIKLMGTGHETAVKFPSGPTLGPTAMVVGVQLAAADWKYDVVSIGYPGPVVAGRPAVEPHNLAPGWVGFDYHAALKRPVKIINDAALQALGSYDGGKMLFLGLGTGMGSAMVMDGVLAPMELAHLPYLDGTFEDHVGLRGLEKFGKKKWRSLVDDVVARLKAALQVDYVVLGGGNSKKLKEMPPGARAGDNSKAFLGGTRLWELAEHFAPTFPASAK